MRIEACFSFYGLTEGTNLDDFSLTLELLLWCHQNSLGLCLVCIVAWCKSRIDNSTLFEKLARWSIFVTNMLKYFILNFTFGVQHCGIFRFGAQIMKAQQFGRFFRMKDHRKQPSQAPGSDSTWCAASLKHPWTVLRPISGAVNSPGISL